MINSLKCSKDAEGECGVFAELESSVNGSHVWLWARKLTLCNVNHPESLAH